MVTAYVPGVLAARSITPVVALTKISPGVDEKVPATPPPLKVGLRSPERRLEKECSSRCLTNR